MRYPTLSQDQMTPEQREVASAIEQRVGNTPDGLFAAMLCSPEMTDRTHRLSEHLRCGLRLPERLRILAVLQALGRHNRSQAQAFAQQESVKNSTLSQEKIETLTRGEEPKAMVADEAAAYTFCKDLLQTGHAKKASYEAIVTLLGKEAALELVAVCGYSVMLGNLLNVTQASLPTADGLKLF